MTRFCFLTFGLILFCLTISVAQAQLTVNPQIVRIKPSEFTPSPGCPRMPKRIVAYLEEEGCLLPLTERPGSKGSAFQINFGHKSYADWAVLCSKKGFSSIYLFRNGSTTNVSQFAKFPETEHVDGRGFFRRLGKTTSVSLTENNRSIFGNALFEIDTWGIDDVMPRRKQVVHYFHRSRILTLDFDLTAPTRNSGE